MPGAREGVRVIDLRALLLGPLATQHLADMGADVISICLDLKKPGAVAVVKDLPAPPPVHG